MKEEIKEKLLREIEDNLISENRTYDERDIKKAIEETSKAKDEEFTKILEADILLFEQVSKCLDCEGCKKIINKRIEEIKQRIKENEE